MEKAVTEEVLDQEFRSQDKGLGKLILFISKQFKHETDVSNHSKFPFIPNALKEVNQV